MILRGLGKPRIDMYRAACRFEPPPSRRTGILPGFSGSKIGLSYATWSVALIFVMLGLQTAGINAGISWLSKNV